MKLALISQIQVSEKRHRRFFITKDQDQLVDSIHRVGLLHPPVLNVRADGTLELLAGFRRLNAVKTLHEKGLTVQYGNQVIGPGQIPYNDLSDVSYVRSKEIELAENLDRVNLNWMEECEAVAELHALRSEENPNQTLTATAKELAARGGSIVSPTSVSDSILLFNNLSRPDVVKAASKKDALRILGREMEHDLLQALGKRLDTVGVGAHVCQLTSMTDGFKKLAPDSIDVIVTDPPYGIDADSFNVDTVSKTHKYKDSKEQSNILLFELFRRAYLACKKQAHIYVFCDVRRFPELEQMAYLAHWEVWPRPMMWVKNAGYLPWVGYGPQCHYESILYAIKGRKPVTAIYSDVIVAPIVTDKRHAAQKPVEVYINLLTRSVQPGDTVLDPFAGSGTIFEAASHLQCQAIGWDSDPMCIALCEERLHHETNPIN